MQDKGFWQIGIPIQPIQSLANCTCYVAQLDPSTRFSLRWGAHQTHCPVYRPSLDQADQLNDQATRHHYLEGTRVENV